MERRFLESLRIDKSDIDKIMSEHGKSTEKLKKELLNARKTLVKAAVEIEEFRKIDVEGIQKTADEWKKKFEIAEQSRIKLQEESSRNEALAELISEIKFTSKLAKKAFISDFRDKAFRMENGKFPDSDDFIKQIQESDPGAFKKDLMIN